MNKRDRDSVGPTQNSPCRHVSQVSDVWTERGRKVCKEREQI